MAEQIGKSRREIQFRLTFAKRFETHDEVRNAIAHFGSWFRLANEALASTAHLSADKDEWSTPHGDCPVTFRKEFGNGGRGVPGKGIEAAPSR